MNMEIFGFETHRLCHS